MRCTRIPETFNAYVAIDPSLWWDKSVLLKQAREQFSKPGLAGRTLFVGQANTIHAGDTTPNLHFSAIVQFNSIMETYNASGLRYAYKYYPNDSHGSVPLIAEYDALRFIFDSYNVPLGQAWSTRSTSRSISRACPRRSATSSIRRNRWSTCSGGSRSFGTRRRLKLVRDERGALPE